MSSGITLNLQDVLDTDWKTSSVTFQSDNYASFCLALHDVSGKKIKAFMVPWLQLANFTNTFADLLVRAEVISRGRIGRMMDSPVFMHASLQCCYIVVDGCDG